VQLQQLTNKSETLEKRCQGYRIQIVKLEVAVTSAKEEASHSQERASSMEQELRSQSESWERARNGYVEERDAALRSSEELRRVLEARASSVSRLDSEQEAARGRIAELEVAVTSAKEEASHSQEQASSMEQELRSQSESWERARNGLLGDLEVVTLESDGFTRGLSSLVVQHYTAVQESLPTQLGHHLNHGKDNVRACIQNAIENHECPHGPRSAVIKSFEQLTDANGQLQSKLGQRTSQCRQMVDHYRAAYEFQKRQDQQLRLNELRVRQLCSKVKQEQEKASHSQERTLSMEQELRSQSESWERARNGYVEERDAALRSSEELRRVLEARAGSVSRLDSEQEAARGRIAELEVAVTSAKEEASHSQERASSMEQELESQVRLCDFLDICYI
jgi:chromosome segregation ATPase